MFLVCAALSLAVSLPCSGAFRVKFADNTNPQWAAPFHKAHVQEELEAWGAEICRLFDGSSAAVDNAVVYLHLEDAGFLGTGGNHIYSNWRVVERVGASDARGALIHELGHAIHGILSDYRTKMAGKERGIDTTETILERPGTKDESVNHLTEGLADWVRRYNFASRKERLDRDYGLAKEGYFFKDYGVGTDIVEYIRRRYGQEKLWDVLWYCSTNRGYKVDKMWPALTGRTFLEVLDDWKHEPRISDPIIQWTYDGSASGTRRLDDRKCSFGFYDNRSGELKDGIEDREWTIAMRGNFLPGRGSAELFSIGCGMGSSFSCKALKTAACHTFVAMRKKNKVAFFVDGIKNAKVFPVSGDDLGGRLKFSTDFDFQDYRVFARALSAKELRMYFKAFHANYNPTLVSSARWIGPGSGSLADPANWECVNMNDDPVVSMPTNTSDIIAWGATVPNVSKGTALPCKSFTVKRWITLDRDTDWRGLKVPVTLDPDATIRTSGHRLVANSVTGTTMRLYGHLACRKLRLTGDLTLCSESVLGVPPVPAKPDSASAVCIGGALRLQDSGLFFFKIGNGNPEAGTYTILTADGGLPDDLSKFRLVGLVGRRTCTFFKKENTLRATIADADVCVWTGAAGDGRFSTKGNWAGGIKPAKGIKKPIVFASGSAGTLANDIGDLSPAWIEFREGCSGITLTGGRFKLPSGAQIINVSNAAQTFAAPVEFSADIHATGKILFSGGVTGLDIHPNQTDILGRYRLKGSGMWTPRGHYTINPDSSLAVDRYRSETRIDGKSGLIVCKGGVFTCRFAQVAQDSLFAERNDGVVRVTESVATQGGWTKSARDACAGEFRLGGITVDGGCFEFNASGSDWRDVNSITSHVNFVIGKRGFVSQGGDGMVYAARGVALGCTDDWTVGKRPNGDGTITSYGNYAMSLYFDTSDHDNRSVKHTVSIEGWIRGAQMHVAAYGGGTIRFVCTDTDQFRGGFSLLDDTTLEYASSSARVGNGDVHLAPGSTLALPSAGSSAVKIAGRLALTNGVGTVNVRLGPEGSAVNPGVYRIATAEGGVDVDLVSHLSLVNAKKGGRYVFSLSSDSKTVVLKVGAAAK